MDKHGIVSFGFFRRAFFGLLCGTASLMLSATAAQAQVQVDSIEYNGDYEVTLSGGTMSILVYLNSGAIGYTGKPYLDLKNISNLAGGTAEHHAELVRYDGNMLQFDYTIQAGDFSSGVDVRGSLTIPAGASISTEDGDVDTGAFVPSLLDAGYTVSIATFYFEGGSISETMPASNAKVNKKTNYRIYTGVAPLSSPLSFEVFFECDDDDAKVRVGDQTGSEAELEPGDSFDATMAVAGNMRLSVTPLTATSDPIKFTIRPASAAGMSDADLTLNIAQVVEEATSIESIEINSTDNKTYHYGETIRIKVAFSSTIQGVSGTPMLRLNVQNQNNDASWVSGSPAFNSTFRSYATYNSQRSGGKNAIFDYVVKAGDYIDDLDAIDIEFSTASGEFRFSGASFDWDIPTGSDSRSLASNANVGIETIIFQDYTAKTVPIDMVEDTSLDLVVSRGTGGAATKPQNFTVTSFNPDTGAAMQSGDKIQYSSAFYIPAGSESASINVTAVETGVQCLRLHPYGYDGTDGDLIATINVTASSIPPQVRLSSTDQIEEGSSALVMNVALSKAPKEQITVTIESSDPSSLRISSVDSSVGTISGGRAIVRFAAGQAGPYGLTLAPLDGYNSISNGVTVTATANKTYSSASQGISVINSAPTISVSPVTEGGEWVITSGFSEMTEGTISWNVSDASSVDLGRGFSATIDFGDGTSTNITCNGSGSVRHAYRDANGDPENGTDGYGILITVTDKDGGSASVRGRIIVTSAVKGHIHEQKRAEGHSGSITYESAATGERLIKGMGEGSIVDSNGTPRTALWPNYDWEANYKRNQGGVTFLGVPADFTDTHPATGEEATFNSFFHVWRGENFTDTAVLEISQHRPSASIEIGGDTDTFDVTGVFSREYYPEDGVADIDFDQLPDDWENNAWPNTYAFESTLAPYGTRDNPDGDFLPECVSAVNRDGSFALKSGADGRRFSPTGIPFYNVYEVRGTHWGLNIDKRRTPAIGTTNYTAYTVVAVRVPEGEDPDTGTILRAVTNVTNEADLPDGFSLLPQDTWYNTGTEDGASTFVSWIDSEDVTETLYMASDVEPQDEPHTGFYDENTFEFTDQGGVLAPFYGTDPTKADTDGDLLTDGYEYFFWRQAKFSSATIGEAYDPKRVETGTPIDNAKVVAYFNPCVANDHVASDFDGDGLTDFEEFLIGTNPVHWDTDGDQMNDGWEVLWGLDPFNPDDAKANPDGDYMAIDANGLMHAEVFLAYGFDPRTAWIGSYRERNRSVVKKAPNTAPFSNFQEYHVARWLIDQGFVESVDPMSRKYMTQPVPSGNTRYYNPSWKGTARKVPNYEDKSSESPASVSGIESYTVPYGDLAFLVEALEITRHGCDSDNDGMPDGWELYLCSTDGSRLDGLWPNSNEEDDTPSAKDATENDFDGDELTNREECHSVELCDYYGSIYPDGKFANVNGNWYNKWWPSNPFDYDTDHDNLPDNLEGDETFRYQASYTADASANPYKGVEEQLAERFGATTMKRGHVPGGGLNPCSVDTDMDYLPDPWEYQFAGENRDTMWEGGFCNATGDQSALYTISGTIYIHEAGGGMDGTYFDSRDAYDEYYGRSLTIEDGALYGIDPNTHEKVQIAADASAAHIKKVEGGTLRDYDFDGDGLQNYQEYLVNGVRHFQYGGLVPWVAGGDYGDYDIQESFNNGRFGVLNSAPYVFEDWASPKEPVMSQDGYAELFKSWDWASYADDWQTEGRDGPLSLFGVAIVPFSYMPSEVRPARGLFPLYASADPRLADSDGDNMDDYYEMFHGLNPILSEDMDYCGNEHPAGETMDFRAFPWMVGLAKADPDGDDKPNWEEALSPNQPAPANHNTDPTPLWMTDMSYARSFVNLYYNWGSAANFWTVDARSEDGDYAYDHYPRIGGMIGDARPHYMFSFESNEGFDTDNDNYSDPYEIDGVAGGVTDPQNPDRPVTRKALYLDGNAAARTRSLCAFGPNALRSFTIEAWVKPEEPASGKMQVILERPVGWSESNSEPTYETVRRNFRLGLTADGLPFVEFDNGGKNLITERAVATRESVLQAGRWYHLAAVRDGFANTLALYVDGVRAGIKSTGAIPYTGFTDSAINAVGGMGYHRPIWAPLVVGAADANPYGKVDGSFDYYNGSIFKIPGGQPQLSNFFKGWIDEVRIWDGARPGGDDAADRRTALWKWPTIKDDVDSLKRYGMDEVLAARNDAVKYLGRVLSWRKNSIEDGKGNATVTSTTAGGTNVVNITNWYLIGEGLTFQDYYENVVKYILATGGEDAEVRIPPVLVCAYSFDTLPDPDYEPVQPARFADLNGRPLDYNGSPWLRGAADRTTVYTSIEAPYDFPQYIQNWVAWLPMGHLVSNGTDTGYSEIKAGARMPLYTLRADSVADSKYWTRDTMGGHPVSYYNSGNSDMFNNFPNNANPYGYRYETSNDLDGEAHPVTTMQESYETGSAVLFNDLVPLRNAKADLDVQLWDDPNGDGLGVNIDSDGDGLPDWWELANGFDPFNADQNGNGVPDMWDDEDGDGLSNYAEYLAGTNPRKRDSDDNGISDYDDSPFGGLSYGELYTDNDHVLDSYEMQWDESFASAFRYDERLDRDMDGWDNWSEALVGTSLANNSFDASGEASVEDKSANFPMPDLKVTLYSAANISGRLVIHAYSDAEMNGWPEAVLAKTISTDILPVTITLTKDDVIFGHLRQGATWFYAWIEKDGTALDSVNGGNWPTWTPGEPAAVADYQAQDGIDIGWDRNEASFHLDANPLGYPRFSFQKPVNGSAEITAFAADGQDHTVTVQENSASYIATLNLKWPRVWVHEGDFQAGKTSKFGVSTAYANATTPNTYSFTVNGNAGGAVTNWFKSTSLAAPKLVSPVGYDVVYASRPAFHFVLPDEATEFQFKLTRLSDSKVIYSKRQPAPKTQSGAETVAFVIPEHVNDLMLASSFVFQMGKEYSWEVTAYNAANASGGTAASGTFQTATAAQQAASAGYGSAVVKSVYPTGWAYASGNTPNVLYRAYESASFNGIPASGGYTAAAGSRTLYGLELGKSYYVMAFIDQNGNKIHDDWEPWGYFRNPDVAQPFAPVAIAGAIASSSGPYEIVIRDPDTDGDLIPDSYEYVLYGASSPSAFLAKSGKTEADLRTSSTSARLASAAGATLTTVSAAVPTKAAIDTRIAQTLAASEGDADRDGATDFAELLYDTDATDPDTDKDGVKDGDEAYLFGTLEAAKAEQALTLTDIDVGDGGSVAFKWNWDGIPEKTNKARLAAASATTEPTEPLYYVIEATDSLVNPQWREVKSVEATSANGDLTLDDDTLSETGARFFRVKLVP